MDRVQNPNMEMLVLTVKKLGKLADEMVFVGGCATGLLLTDPAAPPIRITRDVDVIVQVLSVGDYYQLSEKLRAHGFHEDMNEDAPICRWVAGDLVLDVMPTDEKVLGFGNQWYSAAAKNSVKIELTENIQVRMVSAPYFLITKFAAFDSRGNNDYLMSHDIEDIIAVLDGRPSIESEIKKSEMSVIKEISTRFNNILTNERFLDSVSGHLPGDTASQARAALVIELVYSIAKIVLKK